jgi:hypothetical protein
MAKFSMKKGGKEVGPAEVYARPHSVTGGKIDMDNEWYGGGAFKYDEVKEGGFETRGNGAATKGRKAYGPMA